MELATRGLFAAALALLAGGFAARFFRGLDKASSTLVGVAGGFLFTALIV